MSALNKKISKTELKFLITCSDKDENGKMDCYEFSLMASVLVSSAATDWSRKYWSLIG